MPITCSRTCFQRGQRAVATVGFADACQAVVRSNSTTVRNAHGA